MATYKTCVLILESLRSVENTASIFRTAEGLGVAKIILVGTTPAPVDRFGRSRKDFAKVSLGAESMDWEHIDSKDFGFRIKDLRMEGFKILALEQHPKALNLQSFKVKRLDKFALVVGNEVDGVSSEALESSEAILEIPMRGEKESLNVSVSTGIALFALLQ